MYNVDACRSCPDRVYAFLTILELPFNFHVVKQQLKLDFESQLFYAISQSALAILYIQGKEQICMPFLNNSFLEFTFSVLQCDKYSVHSMWS